MAELIERLAVASFKGEAVAAECIRLANCGHMTESASDLIRKLIEANRDLWRLKDEQGAAVAGKDTDAAQLRDLLARDLELCKARARIRAELNAILGDRPSSESVKYYGGS